jgi:UDP-3-O-[3-hydroxymyristoyl] glucosamine N-acyltransferase
VTLSELAERLECRLEGDGTIDVLRVAGLDDAQSGDVTFLANPKYASRLSSTQASAVIASDVVDDAPCAVLRTAQPYLAFARAVALLTPPSRPAAGISPLAAIDATAAVGPGVSIGAFAYVGPGARVGADTVVYPHAVVGAGAVVGAECVVHAFVSLRDGVVIGDRVVLQDGAVVGSDGFGFATRPDGTHQKIPQVGAVVIEDDVEIGAHSAIDRPAVGETRIGAGTKIDNLVQIAHGVKVGRNALLAAHVGVAGSTVLEDGVVMAGQSGVIGHVTVGKGATVGAKSAVTKNIEAGMHVAGVPAREVTRWRESVALTSRLPDLRKAVADLEARLDALEKHRK